VAVSFCAIVVMVAYPRMKALLEHELMRGAVVSVVALGEVAEQYNAGRDEQALHRAVADHASNSSIAYVYVEDADGTVIAHTPRELLRFLRRDFPRTGERALHGIEVEYRGEPVYESAARVGDSRPGYVHLAFWRHAIEADAREKVASIVTTILAVLCVAIVIAAGAVRFVMLPLSKLVESAQRISNGELDVDIEIKGNERVEKNDEVSSLAHSLVRMRTSLRAVMIRLGKVGPHERSERL
jgi:HAMP domain-containing protein